MQTQHLQQPQQLRQHLRLLLQRMMMKKMMHLLQLHQLLLNLQVKRPKTSWP
jgi:hypothetical protein